MLISPGKLLAKIDSPADLRKLDRSQLPQVCNELRQFIIDNVSVYGGHFGASLGVVELSVALHYVFNTPDDQLIWDVGHQAYGHKILSGRRDDFHTNRTYGGLSGFPKRKESIYDAFGVGHSSTSISAALGMAVASALEKNYQRQHIAIIGDGAMTAGMAFEGMNHAGATDSNLLIVLNDNCMAIDPNVGALKEYLTDITTSQTYNKVRDEVWNILGKLSTFGKSAQEVVSKVESVLKATLLRQSNLFESLGLRYFGPIDGNDISHLTEVLNDLKHIPGPKLLHCLTVKGKGYGPAEKDQTKWHSPGVFDKITGEIQNKVYDAPQAPKFQDVFGHTIVELAEKNEKIIGVTPAMPSGSSLNIMMEKMPDRAFDVGIAEQHAVTFSAGMATRGFAVYCNIYSTFMQRSYDQVIHDVCIQELPVIFCLDRAGLVGADGPTHHGVYDISYMRCIPNMIVSSPMDEAEFRNLLYTAQSNTIQDGKSAFTIRYPRGNGVMPNWKTPFQEVEVGTGRVIKEGDDIAILSFGPLGNHVKKASALLEAKGISIGHYDMRFAKPIDKKMLRDVLTSYQKIITIEDGSLQGGFGSAVLEFMADNDFTNQIKRLGVPDSIIEHGEPSDLYKECCLDVDGIVNSVEKMLAFAAVK